LRVNQTFTVVINSYAAYYFARERMQSTALCLIWSQNHMRLPVHVTCTCYLWL